jgi:hypothetical protein
VCAPPFVSGAKAASIASIFPARDAFVFTKGIDPGLAASLMRVEGDEDLGFPLLTLKAIIG